MIIVKCCLQWNEKKMIQKDNLSKEELLKNFLNEFFDYDGMNALGFWKGVKKDDYEGQAKRICKFFGLKTIYEYGFKPVYAHVTYEKGQRPANDPFVTQLPGIYD